MAAMSEERMRPIILSCLCKYHVIDGYKLQSPVLQSCYSCISRLSHTVPCSEFTFGLPGSGLPGCLSTFSDVAVPVKPKLRRLPAEAQSFWEPFLCLCVLQTVLGDWSDLPLVKCQTKTREDFFLNAWSKYYWNFKNNRITHGKVFEILLSGIGQKLLLFTNTSSFGK